MQFVTRSEGGCDMLKSRNAAKPLSSISLIPLLLSPVNRPATLTAREIEKDESDPPKNGGDLRPFVETCCDMSLLGPRGSLSSSFIPAGRLGTAPPEGALSPRTAGLVGMNLLA